VFLQFIAGGLWHVLLHSNNSYEENMVCVACKFGRPVGNKTPVAIEAFDTRWVHNIQHLFTAILSR